MSTFRAAACILSFWALQACSIDLASGPGSPAGEDRSLPELRGRDIAPAWAGAFVRWAPSGDRITFASPVHGTAMVHDVAAGTTQPLFSIPGGTIYDVQMSADGQTFFSVTSEGEGKVIREYTPAGSRVLTTNGVLNWPGAASWSNGLLVVPGQDAAAFLEFPDQLHLVRRGEPPRLVGGGCHGILAISPDGSRVLCAAGTTNADGVATVNLADGTVHALSIPTPADLLGQASKFHWGDQGIRMLYFSNCCWALAIHDQATNSSRGLASLKSFSGHMSWSGDGRYAAYWDLECVQSGFVACAKYQRYLYHLDPASGTPRRVAVHSQFGDDLALALSPSGSVAAYIAGSHLYLLNIPGL